MSSAKPLNQRLLSGLIGFSLALNIMPSGALAQDEDDSGLNDRYSLSLGSGMSSGGDLGVKILSKDVANRLAYGGSIGKYSGHGVSIAASAEYGITDTMYGTPFVGATFGAHSKDGSTASFYGYDVGMEWWNYDSMSLNYFYSIALGRVHRDAKWHPDLSVSVGVSF